MKSAESTNDGRQAIRALQVDGERGQTLASAQVTDAAITTPIVTVFQ